MLPDHLGEIIYAVIKNLYHMNEHTTDEEAGCFTHLHCVP